MFDGKVIAQFQVPRPSKSRTYLPGDDCSSLRDLLWLHHNHVALAPDFRILLDEFKNQLARGEYFENHEYAIDLLPAILKMMQDS